MRRIINSLLLEALKKTAEKPIHTKGICGNTQEILHRIIRDDMIKPLRIAEYECAVACGHCMAAGYGADGYWFRGQYEWYDRLSGRSFFKDDGRMPLVMKMIDWLENDLYAGRPRLFRQ